MKPIYKYLTIASVALIAAGCSPEEYDGINPNAIPSASDIEVVITNLDENYVILSINNPGCTPVWFFPDGTQATGNGIKKQFPMAGTYDIEVKMYNRNGLCEGSIIKTITFDNTFANFDSEIAKLTDGSEKIWRIASTTPAHLACGPNIDQVTEWWSAKENEKAEYGLYDDEFIFNIDGTYTYNPGADGLTYVNVQTEVLGKAPGDKDFDVQTETKTGTWKFEYRGSDLYLVLSENMLLGYLPYDELYQKPEFLVKSIANKTITLNAYNNSIAWQYILTSAKPTNVVNLWNDNLEGTNKYYNPGWAETPISDQLTVTQKDGSYKVILPIATSDKWQAQVKLNSTVSSSAEKAYDFSVTVTPNQNHDKVTVKLTSTSSDDSYLFDKDFKVEGGKPNELKITGVQGIDAEKLTLVFDFGYNPENFEAEISDITFSEHSGAIEEEVEPVFESNPDGDITSEIAETWKTATYHGDANWAEMNDFTITRNDNDYKIHFTNATDAQWKAQFRLVSDYLTEADQKYDIRVKVKSSGNISKATFKLFSMDESTVNFTGEGIRKDLEAGIVTEFVACGVSSNKAMETTTRLNNDGTPAKLDNGNDQTGGLTILFDFGGNPANCDIEIFDIAIQKSKQ